MCCTGKVEYKSKIDAEYALYICRRKSSTGIDRRKEISLYFCHLCNSFHLTSHPRQRKLGWRDLNNMRTR